MIGDVNLFFKTCEDDEGKESMEVEVEIMVAGKEQSPITKTIL
jgi:hypothetical protein